MTHQMHRDHAREEFRDRVLHAMDIAMNNLCDQLGIQHRRNDIGATDADLPELFDILDDQLERCCIRSGIELVDEP